MLTITIENVWSYLEGDFPRQEIVQATSFQVDGAFFSKMYKRGIWDGRKRLMRMLRSRSKVPTGLIPIVLEVLDDLEWPYEVSDMRRIPVVGYRKVTDDLLSGITLRPYQMKAIKRALKVKRGIIKVPTGGGKTEIAAGIIRCIGLPALFIVHVKDLMWQTKERFEQRLDQEVGVIGDGRCEPNNITVAMVQSLYANRNGSDDIFRAFPVVFGDELHHLSSYTWYDVFSRITAPYRFGTSGTPELSGKGKMLQAMTGDIFYEVQSKELIEKGYLAAPVVKMVDYPVTMLQGYSWQEVYGEAIVWNDVRNKAIVDATVSVVTAQNRTALVLVKEIVHGETLRYLFEQKGMRAKFVQGRDNSTTRREVTDALRDENLNVVVATAIFDEGVDVPSVGSIVLAAGGKSKRQTLQRIGRGMRKTQTKDEVIVLDFEDAGHRWMVRHCMARKAVYAKEGWRVEKFQEA